MLTFSDGNAISTEQQTKIQNWYNSLNGQQQKYVEKIQQDGFIRGANHNEAINETIDNIS